MPVRLINPGVTRTPTMLLKLAGNRIEPPVSSPIPTKPRLAATAAAVPLLEPPHSRSVSYGFFVSPLRDEKPNHDVAKSGIDVLARINAPACLIRAIAG